MNSAEMEYYDSDMKNILWDIYDYQVNKMLDEFFQL